MAARAHLLDAAALNREVGAIGGEAVARARLGEALLDLGERAAAHEQLEEAVALAYTSTLSEHLILLVHGPLLRAAEDPAEALAVIARAEALLDGEPQVPGLSHRLLRRRRDRVRRRRGRRPCPRLPQTCDRGRRAVGRRAVGAGGRRGARRRAARRG